MIYLIGVDHAIQHNGFMTEAKEVEQQKFRAHVESVIKQYRVDLVAEEYSDAVHEKYGTTVDTLQEIGDRQSIEHRYCDPNEKERNELGISKEDHRKREREWIRRLSDTKNRSVIFVCGEDHVKDFQIQASQAGFQVALISRGWGSKLVGGLGD